MSRIRIVEASVRITKPDGSFYPPSSASPRREWGGVPTGAVYSCPRCRRRHELDVKKIGLDVWNGTFSEATDHPELDEVGKGHDVRCECGLVARLVAGVGEYGKMGPYFTTFERVIELDPR